MSVAPVAVSLAPVVALLAGLAMLDSFKLVRMRSLAVALLAGGCAALVCWPHGRLLTQHGIVTPAHYARYLAPLVEETVKWVYLAYLLRTRRIGFLVDAAILGAAVGAGFACLENVYYLATTVATSPLVWVVRGFGTAIMHACATASGAIVARLLLDREETRPVKALVVGLAVATSIHAFYNQFNFPPVIAMLVILLTLPPMVFIVYRQSERSLLRWLGRGFDADVTLLAMLRSGRVSETRVGAYIESLRTRFPGELLADMLCLLLLYAELSIKAKVLLIAREAGLTPPPDPGVKAKLQELAYLEKSLGPTGRLALAPVLRMSSRELWQIHLLH
jgi:protease PrsW